MERFRTVKGYPNYEVSNQGRVLSIRTNKFLKPEITRNGYLRVKLCNKGKNRKIYIHRLVAQVFLRDLFNHFNIKKFDKRIVDHINGVTDDNRLDNLRIITHKENLLRRNCFYTEKEI